MQKLHEKIFNLALLSMFTFLILFPIYMIILNSFKSNAEILTSILAFPQKFSFDNYFQTIQKLKFFSRIYNTAFISIVSVSGIVFFSALAGYKISRTKTSLSKFIYMMFISSMLIPFHSIMISLTKISAVVGARGTKFGLCLIYIGLGVNMSIFLFQGFTRSIPEEIEEAAAMDGCTAFQIFWHVIFPSLKPIATTVAIIDLLWIWNDLLLPLLMINKAKDLTLILGINQFFGQYNTDWSNILAGLIMTSIPIIIFYFFFQKNIVKGITSGAVKA